MNARESRSVRWRWPRASACLLLLAVLVLSGCAAVQAHSAASAADAALPLDYPGALSTEEQLLVGTLRLAEGDLAVTQAQAPNLLFLWKAYRALAASDATAPQELRAVVSQIVDAMTSEQLAAIAAMQLADSDLAAAMQQQAVPAASGEAAQASSGGQPGGMALPAGGPGEMMPGGGPEAASAPMEAAPVTSTAAGADAAATAPSALVEAVMALLAALA